MIKIAKISYKRNGDSILENALAEKIQDRFKKNEVTKDIRCTNITYMDPLGLLVVDVRSFGELTAIMIASKIAKALDIANEVMRETGYKYVVKIEKQ